MSLWTSYFAGFLSGCGFCVIAVTAWSYRETARLEQRRAEIEADYREAMTTVQRIVAQDAWARSFTQPAAKGFGTRRMH